ncbi:hypothetical protein JVU11DRAFT_8313 [Chiua virens]|nr:hypothetical protein JVU11DRAFT_8313 [Chiua virens]
MQGYYPDLQGQHHAVAQHSGLLPGRGSPSGSDDDAGYLEYPESHKTEPGDDDSNAALTLQTLNADGTPKRPMNAFMIFARRRRPQVAAENQSMRTGEVSKILSREWNNMSLSDKQFYLDQAKILKDNFNQKYPDYVYKRRPNNSRKRRKPDPSPSLSADHASTSDLVDDFSGNADYSDVSPVDVADTEDPRFAEQDVRYASLPADPASGTYSVTQSRSSSYQPPDPSYRPLGDTRVSYASRPGRTTPDTGMVSSISSASRGSEHAANYYHPYLSAQQQHHAQPSSYFAESGSTAEVWSSARDDQSRIPIQPWQQSSQDLSADDGHRGYPQAVSPHAWTTNTSGSEVVPSSSSSGASTAGYSFPTLTAPFYPPHNTPQEGFPSSSVQAISVPPQPYSAITPIQGNPVSGRSYSSLQQAYGSGSPSAVGPYQPLARAVPLALPSGQSGSSYSQAQQSASPPPPGGSGSDPSQLRYWSRDR